MQKSSSNCKHVQLSVVFNSLFLLYFFSLVNPFSTREYCFTSKAIATTLSIGKKKLVTITVNALCHLRIVRLGALWERLWKLTTTTTTYRKLCDQPSICLKTVLALARVEIAKWWKQCAVFSAKANTNRKKRVTKKEEEEKKEEEKKKKKKSWVAAQSPNQPLWG